MLCTGVTRKKASESFLSETKQADKTGTYYFKHPCCFPDVELADLETLEYLWWWKFYRPSSGT